MAINFQPETIDDSPDRRHRLTADDFRRIAGRFAAYSILLATWAAGLQASPLENTAGNERIIIIGLDSMHPDYATFNRLGTGPATATDALMPNLRAFLSEATQWSDARAVFPASTDTNHLTAVTGGDTGVHGVFGAHWQVKSWDRSGMVLEEVHLGSQQYEDGSQIVTLFDLAKEEFGPMSKMAYVSNKAWVPEAYLAGFGRPASLDVVVHGSSYPDYIQPPTKLSFYDNPATDEDYACDPEASTQRLSLDFNSPASHPRDWWIAQAALDVMANDDPKVLYVLLGDLDHAQHSMGSIEDPSLWTLGPEPDLPDGCEQKEHYRYKNKRDDRLYKEPILDLVHDVDAVFGFLMDGLREGGYLDNAIVAVLSDHNMQTYLYDSDIAQYTDIWGKLEEAGLTPEKNFDIRGTGDNVSLYWRPSYKRWHPRVVKRAQRELEDPAHRAWNHVTEEWELPWNIMNQQDMKDGRPDLGFAPGEFWHSYTAEHGVWPDLVVMSKPGWQMPYYPIKGGAPWLLFKGSHGGPVTSSVMLAVKGMSYPAGESCAGDVTLADLGVTIANYMDWEFPYTSGRELECDSVSK